MQSIKINNTSIYNSIHILKIPVYSENIYSYFILAETQLSTICFMFCL